MSEQLLNPLTHIRRLNTHLESRVLAQLPQDEADKVRIARRSANATKIIPPSRQKKFLGRRYSAQTIDAISEQALAIIPTEHEARLGMKVLEVDPIREAADRNFRSMQLDNPDQKAALAYWIQNFDSIPEDRSKLGQAVDFLNRPFRELGDFSNLLIMNLGVSLRGRTPSLAEKLVNYPIRKQLASDIVDIYREDLTEDATRYLRDDVARKYQADVDQMKILEHPEFGPRVRRSLIFGTSNTLLRNASGWALYGSLLGAPIVAPHFREFVEQNPDTAIALTLASISIGALARMGVDYWVLKNRGWSADALETVPALMSGKVNEENELKANPWWGVLGTPVDIALNFSPQYSWAFFTNPPYSTYAFALTVAWDQAVLALTNLVSTKIFKVK
ncbi:hypothetical protein HYS93_01925 [Candidatus Daviesbacteria bacterium]|nr:hypothetical protein [Candidatus Daviesbacteria bacterium]